VLSLVVACLHAEVELVRSKKKSNPNCHAGSFGTGSLADAARLQLYHSVPLSTPGVAVVTLGDVVDSLAATVYRCHDSTASLRDDANQRSRFGWL
jgi:hypothetical protein